MVALPTHRHTGLCLTLATGLAIFRAPTPADSQTFTDVAKQAGLYQARFTNGVAVADYDQDGDLDVFMVAQRPLQEGAPETASKLFRNNGAGFFEEVTKRAKIISRKTGTEEGRFGDKMGASWADYDNDGFPDLYLTHLGLNALLRNTGQGAFDDVTLTNGVQGNESEYSSSSVWWDYDLDGDLDLYVCNWVGSNKLYRNSRGAFDDVTSNSGLGDESSTWSALPFDVDLDGYPDIYVVNDFGGNKLFHNLGDGTFSDVTAEYGLANNGNGMGVTLGDFDGNGFFDIYLTNIGKLLNDFNPLFRNSGLGYFSDEAALWGVSDAGWGWGAEFFDYDQDGDLDLYVVNGFSSLRGEFVYSNSLFVNQRLEGLEVFDDLASETATDGLAEARGLAVFDSDADGDLDILVANFKAPPYFYQNQLPAGSWLKVSLRGVRSNRDGVGAAVKVVAQGRSYLRHNDGVEFLGQSQQPLHFGLGSAERTDSLIVIWPGGEDEIFENVVVNQSITLVEGTSGSTTRVSDGEQQERQLLKLFGNAPNPFNGRTSIAYELSGPGRVEHRIYNVTGQLVLAETEEASGAGMRRWLWSPHQGVPSGIYLYAIRYRRQFAIHRLIYLR